MTPEQQNIAIAEACGWHHIIEDDEWGPNRALKPGQKFEMGCVFTDIPDYCNDLNAMHEAERAVFRGSNLWQKFAFELIKTSGGSGMSELDGLCCLVQATAAQRAEAFLRTIGKLTK